MKKDNFNLLLSRVGGFSLVEEEGKIWFANLKANGLYELDTRKKHVRLLTRFKDEPLDKSYLYMTIAKVGNLLVMGSAEAEFRIALYDLSTDRLEYVNLTSVTGEGNTEYKKGADFIKSYVHEENVYLFGFKYPAIVKLNVRTREISYMNDWVDEVKQKVKRKDASDRYLTDYVVSGDFIWILCIYADVLLRLDLRTDEIKVIDINTDLDMHCGICYDGAFWIAGNNDNSNKLLKFDHDFLLQMEIELYSASRDKDIYLYPKTDVWATYPIIDLGNRLLLFSAYPKQVYEFDKISGKARVHPAFMKLLDNEDEMFCELGIMTPRKKDDKVCFIVGSSFLWHEYDIAHDAMTQYEVVSDQENEVINEKLQSLKNHIFVENEVVGTLGFKVTMPHFLKHFIDLN